MRGSRLRSIGKKRELWADWGGPATLSRRANRNAIRSAMSTATARPRRSVLYMPGSNARAQEKAKALPADGIIFDLEDATAPDAKAAARETVCGSVKAGGYGGRELIVRANGLDTPWGKDD